MGVVSSFIWIISSIETSALDGNMSPGQVETSVGARSVPAAADQDPFLLISSDGIEVPVDHVVLSSHSTVIRNMFALPTISTPRCELGESGADLALFAKAISGEIEEWGLGDLRTLTVMADKYDCVFVRAIVGTKLWPLRTQYPLPVYAFATRIGNKELALEAAEVSLRCSDSSALADPDVCALDTATLSQFKEYRDRLSHRASLVRQAIMKPCINKYCQCVTNVYNRHGTRPREMSDRIVWSECVQAALQKVTPHTDPGALIRNELDERRWKYSDCGHCNFRLGKKLHEVRRDWDAR